MALPLSGIYKLILGCMHKKLHAVFKRVLRIIGISLLILFFTEITLTLITQHHVNMQLGFNYATPDTPEGELFIITKVIPGQAMDKAGLKPEDRILFRSVEYFYKLLVNNQGKEVVFPVLRNNRVVTIKTKISEMDLPLQRVSFLVDFF